MVNELVPTVRDGSLVVLRLFVGGRPPRVMGR